MVWSYWLSRQREEADMARGAASTEARLAHHDLAGRYNAKADQVEADVLAGLGIERIPVDQYWVNGFRYTNAGDAIAEAKRGLAQ
jgi:hypothetical protein